MKRTCCLIVFSFFLTLVSAQVEPLYILRGNNRAIQHNPASPASDKIYAGIGLGQLSLNAGSGFLTYNNLFVKGKDGYKYLNTKSLVSVFKEEKKNFVAMDFHQELLGAGCFMGKTYVAASLNLKSESSLNLPGEALAYLLQGNAEYVGRRVRSEFMLNSSTYMEFGVTVQRTFWDKYTFGLRPKYLVGLLNAKTEAAYLELFTDNDWNLHAQARADARLSVPGPEVSPQDASLSRTPGFSLEGVGKNCGFGIDLGAGAEFNDHIGAAVSIMNLGRIRWKNNITRHALGVNESSAYFKDGYLTFEGVDYGCLRSMVNGESPLESIGDSLKNLLSYEKKRLSRACSYTSNLTPKLMLEAHYSFTKNHRVYVLNRTDFYPKKARTSFSLAYSGQFASFFDMALSYSFRNQFGMRNALGIGANFHVSIVNFYISLYNINLHFDKGYYQWKDLNSVALQTGFYFSFGKRGLWEKWMKRT